MRGSQRADFSFLPAYIFTCLSFYQSIYICLVYIYLSTYQSTSLLVLPLLYLSAYLCFYLLIYLSLPFMVSVRFGRRTMCVFCVVSLAVVGICASFVETYVQFLALRFVIAFLCAGLMVISFVLGELWLRLKGISVMDWGEGRGSVRIKVVEGIGLIWI